MQALHHADAHLALQLTAEADTLSSWATLGFGVGIALIAMEVLLVLRSALNLHAFRRGVASREWYWVLSQWKLPPRQLAPQSRSPFAPRVSVVANAHKRLPQGF